MRASGGAGASTYTVPGFSGEMDPVKVAGQIYPILVWRDRLVKVNKLSPPYAYLSTVINYISTM